MDVISSKRFSRILILTLFYVALAELGLEFAIPPGHATPIWPPSGIAFAALFRWGRDLWPGVFLGAVAVNFAQFLANPEPSQHLQAIGVAIAIGVGSALQAWVAAKLARFTLKEKDPFGEVSALFQFLFQAATLACVISSTIAVTTLATAGRVTWENSLPNWGTWFLGDLAGIIVFAPLVLILSQKPWKKSELTGSIGEALLLLGVTAAITWFLFGDHGLVFAKRGPSSYILLPAVLWASIRYGRYGATLSTLVVLTVAVFGAAHHSWGVGIYAESQHEFLLWLQGFAIVLGTMALTFAASLSEKTEINLELQKVLHEKSEYLEYAQSTLEEVVSSLPIVLFSFDQDGIFTLSEGRGLDALGFKSGENVGRPVFEIYRDEPQVLRDAKRALNGEEFVSIVEIQSLHQFWETTWRPKRDRNRKIVGVFGVSINVTQMVTALRMREEFLLVASHELRTPITVLKMQVDLLNRLTKTSRTTPISTEDLAKIIQGSNKQVERFENLISDLLDVSTLTHEGIPLIREEMDLARTAKDITQKLAPDFASAKCDLLLKLPSSAPGFWDKHRLEQVLTHLLTNAIKFGYGKPVELSVEPGQTNTILSVRDHGIGIAPQDQGRIFERFERAVTLKSFGGLGLGLYLANQIVKGHDGKIDIESELDQGTLFRVTLPNTSPSNTASIS